MDEKSKLKNDWKMTDEEMGNTNVPVIINKSYDELHQQLTDAIRKNNLDVDMDKISEAFTLAYESHIGQKRKSGEDYILHPVEVAEILVDMRMDTDTIVAGLLHDVVEDTLISLSDIEYNFGTDVKKLVDGVTKLRNLPRTNSKKLENRRKMVVAMSEDIRVVVIKLADRLHNMRTLKYMTPEKQQEKSKETLEIYAPIAHRIGMARIKWELEDISFRFLYPDDYYEIKDLVNSKRKEREEYTAKFIEKIREDLEKNNIKGEVTGRPKHLYSIYRKMHEKEKRFVTGFEFSKYINNIFIKENPDKSWIKDVSSKSNKQAIMNSEKAFKRFFNKISSFPKFKKKSHNNQKCYFFKNNKTDFEFYRHKIKIPTIKFVRLKEYGYIPKNTNIKSATISKEGDRYFLSLILEIKKEIEKNSIQKNLQTKEGIGIDLGIKDFAICSDGQVFKNINKKVIK